MTARIHALEPKVMSTSSSAGNAATAGLAAFLLLSGCAARPGVFEEEAQQQAAQSNEYLDEQTGSTVSVVEQPLVFARDRSERAANLRDYITLSAATINRGGKRTYVLVAYVWSTLDPRFNPVTSAGDMVLRADDRRIVLTAAGKTATQLGIGRPVHAPAGQQVVPLVYPADLGLLRFLAAAHGLSAQVGTEGENYDYELWDDKRSSLSDFVRFLEGLPQQQGPRK
jgi:hypothetical protein